MKKILIFSSIIIVLFVAIFLITNKKYDYYKNQINPKQLQKDITNNKEKIIYFYQTNCSHCARTSPIVVPLSQKMNINMEVLNLKEYIEAWDLFKIEGTPTIVFYKDGKEINRISGEHSEKTYQDWFENNKKKS
ncbi:TPA: thioredoxin family protein [Bacillus thuringiensis]|nr:thioredoxin family protein [Bacillus thuringiensis]